MANGYFALVLHAHLPFVRHPEDPTIMEEEWLYEAITETYLPLLQTFEGLIADDVHFRVTISMSAPLLAMLTDDLLKERYAAHLDKLIELADKEIERTRPSRTSSGSPRCTATASARCATPGAATTATWCARFRALAGGRQLEIITCTATHAFLPLMDRNWAAIRAQVHAAADGYERHFGRRPQGIWLAECGYVPGVDELLREAGIRYFFVDTHGILFAEPRPLFGVYAPVYCPTRRGRVRPRHRSRPSRSGAPRRATPATRTTATSTATSASTCRSTTSSRTSTRKGTACTRASSTTRSPTAAARQGAYDPDIARGKAGRTPALPVQPREAGRAAARPDGPAAAHRRARTTPSCTATGGSRGRCSWATSSGSCTTTSTTSSRSRRATTSSGTRPTRWRRRAPRRGATRATASCWLERVQRLDLPPPARGGRAHGRAGAPASRAPTALTHARAQPGGARADAGAVERLGVHHEDGDDGAVRHEADQRAHRPLQPALRRVSAARRSTSVGWPTSRRATTFSRKIDYRIYAS